jgi:hypothetical protein
MTVAALSEKLRENAALSWRPKCGVLTKRRYNGRTAGFRLNIRGHSRVDYAVRQLGRSRESRTQ